jgi:nucleotide-binding universal stress UspA family protein
MPQVKKILFPVDFSPSCLGAARYVEAFAGQFEAEIMLFHAVVRGQDTLAKELLPLRKDELDKFLVEDLKYFTTHRVCTTTEDPPSAVADAARSWGPDLVMMPTPWPRLLPPAPPWFGHREDAASGEENLVSLVHKSFRIERADPIKPDESGAVKGFCKKAHVLRGVDPWTSQLKTIRITASATVNREE